MQLLFVVLIRASSSHSGVVLAMETFSARALKREVRTPSARNRSADSMTCPSAVPKSESPQKHPPPTFTKAITWMLLLTTVSQGLFLPVRHWALSAALRRKRVGDLNIWPLSLCLYNPLMLESRPFPDLSEKEPLIPPWGQQWRPEWARGASPWWDMSMLGFLPALPCNMGPDGPLAGYRNCQRRLPLFSRLG